MRNGSRPRHRPDDHLEPMGRPGASKRAGRPPAGEPPAPAQDDGTELLVRVPLGDEDEFAEAAAPQPEPQAEVPGQARPAPGKAAGHTARGGEAAAAGEVDQAAVDRLRSRPQAEPDAATRIRFARLLLQTGSLVPARAKYEALAASEDLDVPGLLDLAEVRWRTGDLMGAGAAASAYLTAGGEHALGFLIAAEAAAGIGRQVEARRHADAAAAKLGPALDDAYAGVPHRMTAAPESPLPPVGIRIEVPAKPQPAVEPPPKPVDALWAQVQEVAIAAEQAAKAEEAAKVAEEARATQAAREAAREAEEATEAKAAEAAAPPEPKPAPEAEAAAQPVEAAPEAEATTAEVPAAAAKSEAEATTAEPEAEATTAEPEAEATTAEPEAEAETEPTRAGEAEAAQAEPEPEAVAQPAEELPEREPETEAAAEGAAPTPPPEREVAPPVSSTGPQAWDAEVAAATAALEAGDPLLAALHYAVALRTSSEAALAVLEGIGDRRDLALELVRVDALRLAGNEVDAGQAYESVASRLAPKPAKQSAPPKREEPEPPPIRWE
jgi:hypothetical protein